MSLSTWQLALTDRKPIVTKEQWKQLLLASCNLMLIARDEAKPRKHQLVDVVCNSLMASMIPEAMELRTQGPAYRTRLLTWMRERMPTTVALACFEAAIRSSEIDTSEEVSETVMCCFSGNLKCRTITLYGNSIVGQAKKQRSETTWLVRKQWVEWIEACMVVGNLHEWTDSLVVQWLVHKQLTRLDAESAEELVNEPAFDQYLDVLNNACIVAYHCVRTQI